MDNIIKGSYCDAAGVIQTREVEALKKERQADLEKQKASAESTKDKAGK